MTAPGYRPTAWETAILQVLAERFPASAQASGGRSLRLKPETAFPSLDRRSPDDYESFLEAAEGLEKAGILRLLWAKRAKGEELETLVLADPAALYDRLGRKSPTDACAQSREIALKNADAGPFFGWLAATLAPRDIDGETLEPSGDTIDAAARLARALNLVASGSAPPKLPRALSVELFHDSKRLERVLRNLQGLLKRAEREDIPLPPFELVDRSFPETLIAGPLSLEVARGSPLQNPSGLILGLPFETASAVTRIVSMKEPEPRGRLLSVENKESFFDLASRLPDLPFDALLYSGGHPNRAVQTLVRVFYSSNWELHHAGDLDPDGILILQELSDSAGGPVHPWHMDRVIFDLYRSQARPLDADIHRRALLIREDTLNRSDLAALLDAILESGLMVEQEIISYGE